MTSHRREQQQPGYVLHHRPFRDSSQILDVFTRDHGKIAVIARGSRGSKSRLAGVLRPFLPLRVSWVAKSDLGTLTGAEAAGPPAGMTGDALLSGYYVNELLLFFLHKYDPQPEIFSLYENVTSALVGSTNVAATLRTFEIELLSMLGYGMNLEHESASDEPLDEKTYYQYQMEQGLTESARSDGPLVFSGSVLRRIAAQEFDDADVLQSANQLLRSVISFHLGGKELKSRKVLIDMHRGRLAKPGN